MTERIALIAALALGVCAAADVDGAADVATDPLACAAFLLNDPVPDDRPVVVVVTRARLQEIGGPYVGPSVEGARTMGLNIPEDPQVEALFLVTAADEGMILISRDTDFAAKVHEYVHWLDWKSGAGFDAVTGEARAYAAEIRADAECRPSP